MSSLKEQGDLFWTLTHQDTQSGILTRFFKFVVVRSFTADSNLLLPTGSVNRTPSHVTFLVFHSTHFNVARDIGSRCLARTSSMYHPHDVVVLILFDSPLCTLHRLSHFSFHSSDLLLHLPCGLVR